MIFLKFSEVHELNAVNSFARQNLDIKNISFLPSYEDNYEDGDSIEEKEERKEDNEENESSSSSSEKEEEEEEKNDEINLVSSSFNKSVSAAKEE